MHKIISLVMLCLFSMSALAQTMLDTAINFTVKDIYGNTINLCDKLDENKLVVIDFFSTT